MVAGQTVEMPDQVAREIEPGRLIFGSFSSPTPRYQLNQWLAQNFRLTPRGQIALEFTCSTVNEREAREKSESSSLDFALAFSL